MNVDPLSEVLNLINVEETVYFHAEFSEPWALQMEQGPQKFHYVLSGQCEADVGAAAPMHLNTGDVLITPSGIKHLLFSGKRVKPQLASAITCTKLSDRYYLTKLGGGGKECVIICGDLKFGASSNHLIAQLPKWIHIAREGSEQDERTYGILRFLASETRHPGPGSEALTLRLADLFVVQSIRQWILRNPSKGKNWINGLSDAVVGKVLAIIHRNFSQKITLDTLSRDIGASRSLLAQRFSEIVGTGPIDYLTTWRMTKAQHMLEEGKLSIEEISLAVGYASLSAFSKAFKRVTGTSPKSAR